MNGFGEDFLRISILNGKGKPKREPWIKNPGKRY